MNYFDSKQCDQVWQITRLWVIFGMAFQYLAKCAYFGIFYAAGHIVMVVVNGQR